MNWLAATVRSWVREIDRETKEHPGQVIVLGLVSIAVILVIWFVMRGWPPP